MLDAECVDAESLRFGVSIDLGPYGASILRPTSVRENVASHSKKRKKSCFFEF